jgi:hypothetical protein
MKFKNAWKRVKDSFEPFFSYPEVVPNEKRFALLFSKETKLAVDKLHEIHEIDRKKETAIINRMIAEGLPVSMSVSEDDTREVIYPAELHKLSRTAELLTNENLYHYGELRYISDRFNAPQRINTIKFILENFTEQEMIDLANFRDSDDYSTQYIADFSTYLATLPSTATHVKKYDFVDHDEIIKDGKLGCLKNIYGKTSIQKMRQTMMYIDSYDRGILTSTRIKPIHYRIIKRPDGITVVDIPTYTLRQKFILTRQWTWSVKRKSRFNTRECL